MISPFINTEVSNNGHLNTGANHNGEATPEGGKKPFFRSYKTLGFRDASGAAGAVQSFGISLERFYARLLNKARKNSEIMAEKRAEAESDTRKLEQQIAIHEETISSLRDVTLAGLEQEKQKAAAELRYIKQNPEEFINKEKDTLRLWLFGVLSVVLALFIQLFYGNVIYSAFFMKISADEATLLHSIFNPSFLSEANKLDLPALLAVLLGPFAFHALGLLLHEASGKKNGVVNLRYWGVLLVTFAFDTLLAYNISKNIYEAVRTDSYDDKQAYSISMAAADGNFWLIIFFGFGVYLVFGSIFGIFSRERNLTRKLERLIAAKEEKIRDLEQQQNSVKSEIAALEQEIQNLKLQITEIRSLSDRIFYHPSELKRIISDYALGWIQYLNWGNYPQQDIIRIDNTIKEFYSQKGIQ